LRLIGILMQNLAHVAGVQHFRRTVYLLASFREIRSGTYLGEGVADPGHCVECAP
jgi:hypothetical protein